MAGELTRLRRARDVRISRAHLWAAAAVLVSAVSASFAAGYVLGRELPPPPPRQDYVAAAEGRELVEVLARVEASIDIDAGVERLTFPHALTTPVEGDASPPGRYTVDVGTFEQADPARELRAHLRAQALPAWLTVERVRGEARYRVSVSDFEGESDAEKYLERVQTALEDYEGAVGRIFVRDRRPE